MSRKTYQREYENVLATIEASEARKEAAYCLEASINHKRAELHYLMSMTTYLNRLFMLDEIEAGEVMDHECVILKLRESIDVDISHFKYLYGRRPELPDYDFVS